MTLKIFNTLTRTKEEFKPIAAGKVGIYACGITAYDSCHIGHARSAVVFDVIIRYLRHLGFAVTFVKNFTDIDDKIIDKARKLGLSVNEVAERYINEHDEVMDALGVERPTWSPRATGHIGGMIALIQSLLDKGFAYQMDGDIYFSVDRFTPYGKLSGRSLADLLAGARVEVNEKKQNPLDFVLWKASKEGEPWWESPWGKGRPGWHIECSVMSQEYLGTTFDIHGGGEDLIFPHHENEIAQSEAASGKTLAHYWIHNGFVRVNQEKMSKSLGNIMSVADILKQYHPEVLRIFFLQSHYRSPVDFSTTSLAEARQGLIRLYSTFVALEEFLRRRPGAADGQDEKERLLGERLEQAEAGFREAMNDDFNSARALGHVFELVRAVNAFLGDKSVALTVGAAEVLQKIKEFFTRLSSILGLLRDDPGEFFRRDRELAASARGLDIGEIEGLIQERTEARQAKDWKRADEIRKTLAERGVTLKDDASGTTWNID